MLLPDLWEIRWWSGNALAGITPEDAVLWNNFVYLQRNQVPELSVEQQRQSIYSSSARDAYGGVRTAAFDTSPHQALQPCLTPCRSRAESGASAM